MKLFRRKLSVIPSLPEILYIQLNSLKQDIKHYDIKEIEEIDIEEIDIEEIEYY